MENNTDFVLQSEALSSLFLPVLICSLQCTTLSNAEGNMAPVIGKRYALARDTEGNKAAIIGKCLTARDYENEDWDPYRREPYTLNKKVILSSLNAE